jgi:quercetin dioxygenase-like cupin family protein
MNKTLILLALTVVLHCAGCASGREPPPYAFINSDELPDLFLAALPGVRAKEYLSDMRTRSASNRIDLPQAWTGTTGGAPGKTLEIFVVSGTLRLADIELTAGGYAYIPPGSLGFRLESPEGARILYFLADQDENSQIRSAIILDSRLLDWQATDSIGVFEKELRKDPGSGERTWLLRYEPGADIPWQSSSTTLEGYLISGKFQDSECVAGEPYTDIYLPGGYFRRPANLVHGGPAAEAIQESVWFLRQQRDATTNPAANCRPD